MQTSFLLLSGLLFICTIANAQNTTYPVTGLDKYVASINDVLTIYGNFSSATTTTVKCQFTVQLVNSTFNQIGSPTVYSATPQLVSNSLVTCKIAFQSKANSQVYVNVLSTTTTSYTTGAIYFVYIDSSIVKLNEQFTSL